jgi:hypothetical protein
LTVIPAKAGIHFEFTNILFTSRRVTLLLFAQKKVTKEKSTPYRLYPALLQKVGRCGTRPIRTLGFKQSSPLPICRSSRRRGKGIQSQKQRIQ